MQHHRHTRQELLSFLTTLNLQSDDFIEIFDVVCLFPKILTDEAIDLISKKIGLPHTYFHDGTCFHNTYFINNKQRYRQTDEASMVFITDEASLSHRL